MHWEKQRTNMQWEGMYEAVLTPLFLPKQEGEEPQTLLNLSAVK